MNLQYVSPIRLEAIVINLSNSFSFAIPKFTQLPRVVIIVYSKISPIVIKFNFQKTSTTFLLHLLVILKCEIKMVSEANGKLLLCEKFGQCCFVSSTCPISCPKCLHCEDMLTLCVRSLC